MATEMQDRGEARHKRASALLELKKGEIVRSYKPENMEAVKEFVK